MSSYTLQKWLSNAGKGDILFGTPVSVSRIDRSLPGRGQENISSDETKRNFDDT